MMNRMSMAAGLLVATTGMLALSSTASAAPISLTPADADCSAYIFPVGNEEVNFVNSAACSGGSFTAPLYKIDAPSTESGGLAGSYSTSFSPDAADASGAVISYDGGDAFSCMAANSCWLVVKDGNVDPNYYGFDLTGWDGVSTITLSNFWPGQGAISHISIFGQRGTVVPEPATLGLLGLGLLGLGLGARRRRKI